MSDKEKHFWVRSMYGFNTREPLVVVTMPGGESVQMSPEDAREVAGNLYECADAAEGDAFLMQFLGSNVGLKDEQGALVLKDFREWREKRMKGTKQ